MELVVEPDVYSPSIGENGNYVDKIPAFNLIKKGHEYVKDSPKQIMVTHMHPSGSKAEFSGFEGSKAVRRAIKEFHPNILITAHIHEASGIEEDIGKTRVINVSRKEKIFEI